MTQREYIRIRDIPQVYGISPRTIHRWALEGPITKRKVGARITLIKVAELNNCIETMGGQLGG